MRIFVHRGLDTIFDATPEQIQKVMNLYNRPGTPGEKAAAAAALERMGVRPPIEGAAREPPPKFRPRSAAGPKRYSVRVDYEVGGQQTFAVVDVTAGDELEAEEKARAIIKKEKGAKNIRSGQARREN